MKVKKLNVGANTMSGWITDLRKKEDRAFFKDGKKYYSNLQNRALFRKVKVKTGRIRKLFELKK